MTNEKHTDRDTGGQIQSIDDQLRQMFQIHASLFDEQERKVKRFDCTIKDSGDINFPSFNKECK